jgi:hypothetical protein
VGIAIDRSRSAFDFDEKQPSGRQDQGIDLADLAIVINELEIGPDVPWVAVG